MDRTHIVTKKGKKDQRKKGNAADSNENPVIVCNQSLKKSKSKASKTRKKGLWDFEEPLKKEKRGSSKSSTQRTLSTVPSCYDTSFSSVGHSPTQRRRSSTISACCQASPTIKVSVKKRRNSIIGVGTRKCTLESTTEEGEAVDGQKQVKSPKVKKSKSKKKSSSKRRKSPVHKTEDRVDLIFSELNGAFDDNLDDSVASSSVGPIAETGGYTDDDGDDDFADILLDGESPPKQGTNDKIDQPHNRLGKINHEDEVSFDRSNDSSFAGFNSLLVSLANKSDLLGDEDDSDDDVVDDQKSPCAAENGPQGNGKTTSVGIMNIFAQRNETFGGKAEIDLDLKGIKKVSAEGEDGSFVFDLYLSKPFRASLISDFSVSDWDDSRDFGTALS